MDQTNHNSLLIQLQDGTLRQKIQSIAEESVIKGLNTTENLPSVILTDFDTFLQTCNAESQDPIPLSPPIILFYRQAQALQASSYLKRGVFAVLPAGSRKENIASCINLALKSVYTQTALSNTKNELKNTMRSQGLSGRNQEQNLFIPVPSENIAGKKDGIRALLGLAETLFHHIKPLFETQKPRLFNPVKSGTRSFLSSALNNVLIKNKDPLVKRDIRADNRIPETMQVGLDENSSMIFFQNILDLMLSVPGNGRKMDFFGWQNGSNRELKITAGPMPVFGNQWKKLAGWAEKTVKGPIPRAAALWKECADIAGNAGGTLVIKGIQKGMVELTVDLPD